MKRLEQPNLNTARDLDAYWRLEWDRYMAKPYRDLLYRQFCQTLPPCSSILDVCSGPSRLRLVAAELGHRVVCVDLSEYVVSRLLGEGVHAFRLDVTAWSGELFGRFDAAVCSEALEHLEVPGAACSFIAAHTDRALFTVPHKKELDDCGMHVWQFEGEDLLLLLDIWWTDIDICDAPGQGTSDRYWLAWVEGRRC